MDSILVNRLVKLINVLSIDSKLEILSKISDSLRVDLSAKKDSKEKLLEELYGSWADADVSLSEDIISMRSVSEREINLD